MENKKSNNKIWILTALVAASIMILGIGGVIIYEELNEPTWEEEQQMLQESAELSAAEAEEIALAQVPGTVTATSLEDEGFSKVVYSVQIQTETGAVQTIEVDAKTGEILEIEIED